MANVTRQGMRPGWVVDRLSALRPVGSRRSQFEDAFGVVPDPVDELLPEEPVELCEPLVPEELPLVEVPESLPPELLVEPESLPLFDAPPAEPPGLPAPDRESVR